MTAFTIHRRTLLAGVAVLAATPVMPALAADTLKIAIGQRGNWENAAPHLGQEKGFFKQHDLVLDLLYTQGGGETMQAVLSNSVDIGVGVGTSGVMAAFAKGAPVRAIGNSTTGANDLYWYVPADSAVKSFKDLAGKTVAYSTNGSSTNLAVLGLIKHFDVAAKPVATGSPATTFTQVMSGQIDCGWSSPPFGLQALQEGKIRIIARGSDVPTYQDQTVRLMIANVQAAQGKNAAINRYLAAYAETLDWMYSNDEALEMYAKWVGVPVALARKARDEFYPRDKLVLSRLSGVDLAMETAVSGKFIPAPLPQAKLDELFKYYARPRT